MKKAFEVYRQPQEIKFRRTRDSVAAGDDFDAPHESFISLPPFVDPLTLAKHLSDGYLATVSGVGHHWDCILNGTPIAEVGPRRAEALTKAVMYGDTNHVHFRYHSARY